MSGTTALWSQWIQASVTTTTTGAVWTSWITTAASTTTGNYVTGVNYYDNAGTTGIQWQGWNLTYEETAERAAERRAEQVAAAERGRVANTERAAASETALALLMELLTEDQVTTMREAGYFEVTGSAGGRYRIRTNGQTGNVDRLDDQSRRVASLCAHPPGGLPDSDAHLAQMLALVTDEDTFVRTANVHHHALPAAA